MITLSTHKLAGLKGIFKNGYEGITESYFPKVTTEYKSNSAKEDFTWLGSTPGIREWVGERQAKGIHEKVFTVKPKKYESTIAIDVDDLADDKQGQLNLRVKQMAEMARRDMDNEFADGVVNLTNTLCYDGQNFFDTDHREGDNSTPQSNAPTPHANYTFSPDGLMRIVDEMASFRDDKNRITGHKATHVMVPSALGFLAKQYLDPATVGVSTTPKDHLTKGLLKVIVNPYLPSNGINSTYYVLDLSKAIKPFLYLNRLEPTLEQDNGEKFQKDVIYLGTKSRFNFTGFDWRCAFRAEGS